MAGPIYKLWMMRMDQSMNQLSAEEQQSLVDKIQQALKQVGGKTIVMCASGWANEQWQYFGVEEFPDIEAVQKLPQLHFEIGWFGYGESFSLLGVPSPG